MKPIQVGLLGIGTVGSGTFTVLRRNQEEIRRRAGPRHRDHARSPTSTSRAHAPSPAAAPRSAATRVALIVDDPSIDIVVELIGGTASRATLVLRGDRRRQARRHRQQGAARRARHRDLRRGAREGRDGRVRGGGGGRHPDHQGAARRADGEPHRVDRRASSTARPTSSSRRCATSGLDFATALEGGAAPGLRRSRSDLRHRRHRRRAQGDDHERDRVRRAGAVRQGATSKASASCRRPTSATPRSSATASSCSGITRARDGEGIELRVHPTLVPAQAPDRQRRRRDERGAGAGRRGRHDALLRQGRGRRADRLGGDRRPGRHHAPAHRRPRASRAAPRVPAGPPCRTSPILPIDDVVDRVTTCACGSPTRPACWRDITRILAEHGISIDALLQRPGRSRRRGEARTDVIILTHDTVEGTMTAAIAKMQALPTVLAKIVAHPQGRTGVKYVSTRGDRRGDAPSPRSCSKVSRPTAGCTCPSAIRSVDAPTLARWRTLLVSPSSRSRSCRSSSTTSRRPICARWSSADLHRRRCSATPRIAPLRSLEPGVLRRSACRTVRRSRSRTWRCSCSATCSSTSWRGAASTLNILGATSGDTGSAAEYAMRGKHGVQRVHAVAARPHEPVPAGADVQPAGRRTSTTSPSKACSTTARTSSRRSRTTSRSSARHAIGTVNSINWARLLAQVVYYFAGYFQATEAQRRARSTSPCRRATSATSAPATSRA